MLKLYKFLFFKYINLTVILFLGHFAQANSLASFQQSYLPGLWWHSGLDYYQLIQADETEGHFSTFNCYRDGAVSPQLPLRLICEDEASVTLHYDEDRELFIEDSIWRTEESAGTFVDPSDKNRLQSFGFRGIFRLQFERAAVEKLKLSFESVDLVLAGQ